MIDRKPEREITDQEELARVLEKALVLHLGMCGEDGPYVVPMSYGLGQGCLFLHSSLKGKKAAMLRADQRVCFSLEADTAVIESDGPCGYTMKFKSVVGYGRVVFLEAPEDKLAGLKAIMAHYSETDWADGDFNPKVLDKTLVMRLDIESMRGAKHGWNR
ncbi:pyridoxamine 5'-phosphate oxidase family protein [Desulfocurvus sp. DL9XJH121]